MSRRGISRLRTSIACAISIATTHAYAGDPLAPARAGAAAAPIEATPSAPSPPAHVASSPGADPDPSASAPSASSTDGAASGYDTHKSPIKLGGTVRTLPAAVQPVNAAPGSTGQVQGTSITQLRLTMKGSTASWNSLEVHAVQVFATSTIPAPAFVLAGLPPPRYRAFELTNIWASTDLAAAAAFVDRFAARLSVGSVDVTIGRQVINFSKTYFWSPLDVFLPFTPSTIDREYKPSVDAVRVDLTLGESSGLNFIAAVGSETPLDPVTLTPTLPRQFVTATANASAALVRGFATLGDWDLSVQAGSVYGGYHAGAGIAGEVLTLGVRAEAAYEIARDLPLAFGFNTTSDHASAVLGVERRFDNSLYVSAEYFFNGAVAGAPADLSSLRVNVGETPNMGEHMAGVVTTYDLFPTLKLRLGAVTSVSPSLPLSALFLPGFDWSVGEDAEITAGALVTAGPRPTYGAGGATLRSEFGGYPNAYYALFKYYFGLH